MIPKHLPLLLAALWCAQLFAQPVGRPPEPDAFFDDPQWRERFLGSYGFLSDVEPGIAENEREALVTVLDLMENAGPRQAADALAERITPESSAALHFILGNLHFQSDRRTAAKRHYQAALRKHEDFLRAHQNLGLLLVQDRDYADARVHLSRSIELGARDGRTYGLLGYINMQSGNLFAAEAAYRDAIAQEPEQNDWKLGLAQVLLELGDHEALLSVVRPLIRANPSQPDFWVLKANAHVERDEPIEAAVALETARALRPASTQLLKLLADIYMKLELFEAAETIYTESLVSGEHPERFRDGLRAARLLFETDNIERADRLAQMIEDRFGDTLSRDERLDVLTLRARIERARGNRHEAARVLREIIEEDRTRGSALIELADYHWTSAETLEVSTPTEEDAPSVSGQAAAAPQTHREMALQYLREAAAFEASRFDALLKHAQFLVDEKAYGEAAGKLRAALKIKDQARVRRFLEAVERATADT